MREAPLIPEEAVQAAAEALTLSFMRTSQLAETSTTPYSGMSFEQFATVALEAAAPVLAAQVRQEVAEQIRGIAHDDERWGFVNFRAFLKRHKRLVHGSSPIAVLLAVADEIEEKTSDLR